MATDKAPYKLIIKLDSARPDALSEALNQLRDIASDHDQAGEAEATVVIESFKEAPLHAICETFEEWLWRYKIGLGCKMRLDRPGVRPEMAAVFRARHETPMDQAGWEGEKDANGPLITPPPVPMRALPAPMGTIEFGGDDATFVVEESEES